LYNSADSVLTE